MHEEAKFFYDQMEIFLQKWDDENARTKFFYFLDAFLCATRSVTSVFQKEFKTHLGLRKWYKHKVDGWKNNEIMQFFKNMRNISLKEHTPETITLRDYRGQWNLRKAIVKVSANGQMRMAIPRRKSTEKNIEVIACMQCISPTLSNSKAKPN